MPNDTIKLVKQINLWVLRENGPCYTKIKTAANYLIESYLTPRKKWSTHTLWSLKPNWVN